MINNDLSALLTSYKKTENLQSKFDTNSTKLTANNYNHVLSAIFQMAQTGIIVSGCLEDLINNISGLLTIDRIEGDQQLKILIDELSARNGLIDFANKALSATSAYYAVDSISADYSINALTANYALTAYNNIGAVSFVTNNNQLLSYNGAASFTVNGILSSKFTQHALSADNAINALHANQSIEAVSAQIAYEALKVRHNLFWFNSDEQQVLTFDGSYDQIVSSVLFSVSSKLCNQAQYAISADCDGTCGYPLNTRVQYLFSQDENYDFPILFSAEEVSKIESNNNYNVRYHQQININPYLGAIKANYFIGTAVSATYAICDQYSNLLNTRVCQNSTNNNYNYPIALSFIDSHGDPTDGVNHQLLYTANMRINPYNDIIFPKEIPTDIDHTDIDYAIYNGTYQNRSVTFTINGQDYEHAYTNHQGYNINFVGLATRALCDVSGYPLNEMPITHNYNNVTNISWNPLIIGTKSGFNMNNPTGNLSSSCHDTLVYSKNIIVNPTNGSMNLSGNLNTAGYIKSQKYVETVGNVHSMSAIICDKWFTCGTYANIWGDLATFGSFTVGTIDNPKASTLNGRLAVNGSTTLCDTVNISGATKIDSTLVVKTNVTSPKFIGVATSAQWADLAQIYQTDIEYPIGTLIQFGGQKEITIATNQVNGVISDKPGYLMNSTSKGQPIALVGRVYIRIKGIVNKFDYITISDQPGVGISNKKNKINAIARALHNKFTIEEQLLQCVVKLEL